MSGREHQVRERSSESLSAVIRGVVAVRLQAWRRSQRIPMKRLAAELGVSISTVSSWESGLRFPGADNLAALAKRTGIPACKFVCSDGTCAKTDAQVPAGVAIPRSGAEALAE